MSEDFPGFVDDTPKEAKKEPPKDTKKPGEVKGFNAFADVAVAPSKADAPPPPAKPTAAKQPGTARGAKPVAPGAAPLPVSPAASATAGFNAFASDGVAPSAEALKEAEADVKPGARKDLWPCPHCGSKNRPDRSTCRECGKSPSDEVEIKWHEQPQARIAMAAGAVVVVLLLGWLLFGGSAKLVPADVGHIDSKVRYGGSTAPGTEVGPYSFKPTAHAAVCGRVVGSGAKDGLTVIVLALGSDGRNEEAINNTTADCSVLPPSVQPDIQSLPIYAFGEVPTVTKGQIVSLLGDVGKLTGDGAAAFEGGIVIRVQQSNP